ncbi:hypothetical protein ACJZ2D_011469 [Fusarium nematophilum]
MSSQMPSVHSGLNPVFWSRNNPPQLTLTLVGALISFLAVGVVTLYSVTPKQVVKHMLPEDDISDSKKRREQYCLEPRALIIKGYKKFRDQIWGIESFEGVRAVSPVSYLHELKSHPALSFEKLSILRQGLV